MSIKAMTGMVPEDFISRHEGDPDNPTIWKLQPLDGFAYMEVMSELKRTDTGYKISGHGLGVAVRKGLVGWENYHDENGKEIKFNPLNMKKIPAIVLGELADRIIDISELGDEQAKNS